MIRDETSGLASRLRERVVIQSRTLTSDGLGGNSESWTDLATVFAQVIALSGSAREQVIAAQREARNAYRIVMRKRSDVNTQMRLQWQGRILHIHGVVPSLSAIEMIAYEGGEA
ncbi:MAG: phage head closure protein [Alphaproteobacteria bacterium]|nr:phage head closure protein [Alphaproteobacteria bacterium]